MTSWTRRSGIASLRDGLLRIGTLRTGLLRIGTLRTGLLRIGTLRTGLLWVGLICAGGLAAGCAYRSTGLLEEIYGTLLDDLLLLADRSEAKELRAAARTSDEILDDAIDLFWARRDPTPGTPRNEFWELFEARREAAADQLVFPGCYLPDDRRIPFLLYGPPSRIEESAYLDTPYLTWFYEPDETVLEAASEHPLLADLFWHVSFMLSGNYGYQLDVFTPRTRRPPPLDDHTRQVLIDLAGNETGDPLLCAAAAWRLRFDLHPATMAAQLRLAETAGGLLFESVSAGLTPLPESGPASGGTRPLILDQPSIAPAPGFPAQRFVRPQVDVSAIVYNRSALVYDPGRLLTDEEIVMLQGAAEEAGNLADSRSWLTPEDAAALYSGTLGEARDMIIAGRMEEAHALLDRQLRQELLRDPEAWHLDAIVLLSLGEPGARQLAEDRVRQAIRLAPGDARYRLTLARILFNRTFGNYSEMECDRVLEEQPGLADAYALKAQMRITLLYGLGWHGSEFAQTPLGEGATTLGSFRLDALEFLNRALTCEPGNLLATWYLGVDGILNADRTEDWSTVLPIMNYLVESDTHRAEALLGRGLALQSTGYLPEAWESYVRGVAVLSAEKVAIAQSPGWSLAPSEGGIVIGTSTTGAAATGDSLAVDLYWRHEDPLFSTALNERLMEQYRRLAWVSWHYAVPEIGLRGWDTVRGRVYLRYGEPDRIVNTLSSLEDRMQGRVSTGEPTTTWFPDLAPSHSRADMITRAGFDFPSETWYYGEKIFTFGGGFASGDLTFWPVWSESVPEEILDRTISSASEFAEYADEVPDSDRVIGAPEVLSIATTWYRFEDAAGRDEFIGVVSLPLEVSAPGPQPHAPPHAPTDRAHVVLLTGDWRPVRQDTLALPPGAFISPTRQTWVTSTLHPPAGDERITYIAVELLPDQAGDPAYAGRDTLAVPPVAGPRISSLVLAREVAPADETDFWQPAAFFTREGTSVAPYPTARIRRGLPVYLYFETYGLGKDEYGTVTYEIAYSVTALEGQQGILVEIVDALGRLIGRQEEPGTVTLLFEREGISTRTREWQRVVFPGESEEGSYRLTIAVTDKTTGERTEQSTLLHIIR